MRSGTGASPAGERAFWCWYFSLPERLRTSHWDPWGVIDLPLGRDPQANMKEILRNADENPSSRFYKLKRKSGMTDKHFMLIVEAAAYSAARAKGFNG